MEENRNINSGGEGELEPIGKRAMPAKPFFKSPWGIATTVFIGLLLALIIAAGSVMAFYKGNYPGVCVENIILGGKNIAETQSILEAEFASKPIDKELKMFVNSDEYTLKIADLGASYDFEQTAANINTIGRTGNVFERISEIYSAMTGKINQSCVIKTDVEKVRREMETLIAKIGHEVIQPSYRIKGTVLTVDRGVSGLKIDDNALTALVIDRLNTGSDEPINYSAEVTEPNEADLASIQALIKGEMRNATLDLAKDPSGKAILPSTMGATFDLAEAQKVLDGATERMVEIPAEIVQPEITTADLKSKLFRDTLSATSSKYNAGLKDRTKNVNLAAQFINGTVLNPGDVFSYNKEVGPRTYARGFVDATIFANGATEEGIGGGICQVSSTLYLAALKADLHIAERRNHSLSVSYVPLGQDATVSYGNTDFKFKNNTKYPIKILANASGSTLTVKILGTAMQNKKVELQTTVLSKDPFTVIEQDDPTLPIGTTKVKNGGYTGYKTSTYRVVYIDGVEQSRTHENNSNYKRVDKIILVGTAPTAQAKPTEPTKPTEPIATPDPDPNPDPVPTPSPDVKPEPKPEPKPVPQIKP